jgi:hypothetical protein
MKAKLLNLRDALRLAFILDAHIDKETTPKTEALDFISGIVEKIDPSSFLRCVILLSGEPEENVVKEISIDILTCFIEGLRENQILSLISFYRSLGK